MSVNPLAEMIATFLRDLDAWNAKRAAAEESWRADGYRLVNYDQTPDHQLSLSDPETGEQLFLGSLEEGEAFLHEHDMATFDGVHAEVELDGTEVPGIPLELQERVREWVLDYVGEARAYLHQLQ